MSRSKDESVGELVWSFIRSVVAWARERCLPCLATRGSGESWPYLSLAADFELVHPNFYPHWLQHLGEWGM